MTTNKPTKKVAYVDDLYALVYKFPETCKQYDPDYPWGVQFSHNPMKYIFINKNPYMFCSMGTAINHAKERVKNNKAIGYGELKPSRIIHVEGRVYERPELKALLCTEPQPLDGRII